MPSEATSFFCAVLVPYLRFPSRTDVAQQPANYAANLRVERHCPRSAARLQRGTPNQAGVLALQLLLLLSQARPLATLSFTVLPTLDALPLEQSVGRVCEEASASVCTKRG